MTDEDRRGVGQRIYYISPSNRLHVSLECPSIRSRETMEIREEPCCGVVAMVYRTCKRCEGFKPTKGHDRYVGLSIEELMRRRNEKAYRGSHYMVHYGKP